MTKEQILTYIENAKARIRLAGDDVEFLNSAKHDLVVHEMALQSLSQESVRSEALEDAAKVCDAIVSAMDQHPYAPSYAQSEIEALEDAAERIRALQSPARVAEGGHQCTNDKVIRGYQDGYDIGWCGVCGTITWGSDGLIGNELTSRRDHSLWKAKNLIAWSCSREARGEDKCKEWCGHQRHCTAATKKWPSPESPAKEQPGDPLRGLGLDRDGDPLYEPAVAAPDAAAMVKRLRELAKRREDAVHPNYSDVGAASLMRDAAAMIEKLGQDVEATRAERLEDHRTAERILRVTDDKLADDIEKFVPFDWTLYRQQIIAALRRQPSSDKVLVPRELRKEKHEQS